MELLTRIVQAKLRKLHSNKFALVFDSWATADVHYVAMQATFPAAIPTGYRKGEYNFIISPFTHSPFSIPHILPIIAYSNPLLAIRNAIGSVIPLVQTPLLLKK